MQENATQDLEFHPASRGARTLYGQACVNCSRSKCKCVSRPAGGACERCHRLQKSCQPSFYARKRPKKRLYSQTARLEEKLDGLMTMLQQSRQHSIHTNASSDMKVPRTPDPSTSAGGEPSELGDTCSVGSGLWPQIDNCEAGGTSLFMKTQMCDVKTVADELPSEDEAQALFESFRDQNLKYFPFLHFKKTVTSKELREERPFLWLCIITVTTRLPKQQIAWGQRVRQAVAQKLINENEKNIEYFLGLLIILSWPSHYLGDRSFTSLMCQIAKALYFDLGLYTEPLASSSPLFRWKTAQENGGKVKTLFQDPFPKSQLPRTMEQRRAIVACYVITSIISDVIEKNDALRWSPHMNECLTILDEQSEVPSDRILAALTRIQLLSEEARSHTLQLNVSFDEFNNLRTPASTYARLLQDRLQCIIRNLPPELQSADIIISQIHYTELVIQEIALPTRNKVDSSASLPDIARLNSLYMCLHYIKAWFGHFYTIPPAAYYAISYPFFARLRLCFTSLYRLSILEDPVWDRMSARNTIDLITTLDEVGDRFMRAGNGAGSKSEVGVGNGFAKAAESISVLKELCEIALAPLDTSMDPAAALSCVASTDMLDTVALPPPPPPPPLAGGAGEVKGYQLGMNPTDWRWSTDPFTSFDF